MSNFTDIYTGGLHVGSGLVPSIASATFEQSLDPTRPFATHSLGINQFESITNQLGIHNQVGLYNGIGMWDQLGVYNGIGQGIFVGGHQDCQPYYDSSAVSINLNSPEGDFNGFWKYNGNCIQTTPCSDSSAKKDIKQLENSLEKIKLLRGVSFNWDENVVPNLATSEGNQVGLIAQEVEEVVPEVVFTTIVENNKLKSIKYENLTSLLIEAVKEQQEQINELKKTVSKLSTGCTKCSGSCYSG
jgi:hypothetical protein